MFLHFGSEVFSHDRQEFTLFVYHRDLISKFILHEYTRYIIQHQSSKVIRTESLSQVHDSRTVFGSHIVPGNHVKAG
jgi:hypothetical protein